MRPHTDLLPDAIVDLTRLARPRVVTALRVLKDNGRIVSGRPYAPPLTNRCVARIILALAAPVRREILSFVDAGHITAEPGLTGEELLASIAAGNIPPARMVAISDRGVEVIDGDWRPRGCCSFFFIAAETVAAIANEIRKIECSAR